jgi:predicted lipid-binding transport protein (Tim44 family)
MVEQSAMPTFAFWYAVFLAGSAAGATAGSAFGNGFAFMAGLLGGLAISGWIADHLLLNRSSATCPAKPLIQPSQTPPAAQGLERIRFASASQRPEVSETKAAERDTVGGAFSLPKGMYEFAMRKQSEKQASFH